MLFIVIQPASDVKEKAGFFSEKQKNPPADAPIFAEKRRKKRARLHFYVQLSPPQGVLVKRVVEPMNRARLTGQEERFCRHYRATGNGLDAALLSGYPGETAEEAAAALLSDPRIGRRLLRLRRADDEKREQLLSGLIRLAFGRANDPVRLALSGGRLPEETLERMDFFNLSELKIGDKGIEVKLFDRQKAFALLQEILRAGEGSRTSSFYEALEESARLLGSGSE